VEEPKDRSFWKLILYLLIEAILLSIMALFTWLPYEFALMIHQTCASLGGKILAKILNKMKTGYDEDTQAMLRLHRSRSCSIHPFG
jgi:hypothetical protein